MRWDETLAEGLSGGGSGARAVSATDAYEKDAAARGAVFAGRVEVLSGEEVALPGGEL